MTVHFIGAGPGDPDLITVRGQRLIQRCALCLYAGSLVPEAVVAEAPESARVIDTASMTLDDIMAEIGAAVAAGHKVARVHSGDPSLYGAIAEQIRRLKVMGIAYDITPGVSAYAAAAAGRAQEFMAHMPEKSDSTSDKALVCPMPGVLISVNVEEGQAVKAGEALAVVEAMKMENILRAEKDATVSAVLVAQGDKLAVDDIILEFE